MTTAIQEFDYSVNLLQSLLWQYNDASNLQSLITRKQTWYSANLAAFWGSWYTNVFDLRTANTFGLAVWSIILDLPLFIPLSPDDPNKPVFGFNEEVAYPTYVNTYLNFENGNFFAESGSLTLTDSEQRFLLRLRYFNLTTRGDTPDINQFLKYLKETADPDLPIDMWVFDNLDMTMTYVYNFPISEQLQEALTLYDVLPRPAGVGVNNIIVFYNVTFGFSDNFQNFENGNFEYKTF